MSRVHEALKRAGQVAWEVPALPETAADTPPPEASLSPEVNDAFRPVAPPSFGHLLERVQSVPYRPSPKALLVDPARPQEAPMEEFRSLRTRLNHMQTQRQIRSVVITSPSPTEGKSFTAVNLALTQAQLADYPVLLCDFDFRRPIVHTLLGIERTPGLTDYLQGKVLLHEVIRRIEDWNLYVLPAGTAVINPLELLNLREARELLAGLPSLFNWVLLDSPPLLYAADANLLSTLCDGTILVVRIGATSIDSVTRAMQTLCQDNVLGIVVNGARRGELYSKYNYYNYYSPSEAPETDVTQGAAPVESERLPG